MTLDCPAPAALDGESWIDLKTVALTGPRINGRPIPRPTLLWWARVGVRGIKLETRLVGNKRVTSLAALHRFLDRTNTTAPAAATA